MKVFLDEEGQRSLFLIYLLTHKLQHDGKWDHFVESSRKINCDLKQLEGFRLLSSFTQ